MIEEGIPVIALVTQDNVLEKTVSNIKEVKARGADVMAITHEEHVADLLKSVDQALSIPEDAADAYPGAIRCASATACLLRCPGSRQ